MHHYEPNPETPYSVVPANMDKRYIYAVNLPNQTLNACRWNGRMENEVRVALPAGMYAYQFEIDGRRTRDKTVQGTVNPTHSRSRRGCWSRGTQLVAPNCSVANAFYLAKPRVTSNCGVILLHLQTSFICTPPMPLGWWPGRRQWRWASGWRGQAR